MQRNRREAAEGSNTVKAMQETETAAILSASETALRLIGYFMPVIGLIMAIIKTIRLKDPQKRTCSKALVMTYAYSNAILDKVNEAVKNGVIGNENDDW